MTRNKNRKDRIRERAAATGRSYTAANNADASAKPADPLTVTIERIALPPEDTIDLGQLWDRHRHRNLLIAGRLGSGQSVMLGYLITAELEQPNRRLVVCDPKRTDLPYLADHPQVDAYAGAIPEIAAAIREVRGEVDRRAAEASRDRGNGAGQGQSSRGWQSTITLVIESIESIVHAPWAYGREAWGSQGGKEDLPAPIHEQMLDDLTRIVTAGPELGVHTLATVWRPADMAAHIVQEMGLRLSFGWQSEPDLHALFGDARAAAEALQHRTRGRALSYAPEAGALSVIRVPPPAGSLVTAGRGLTPS